MKKCCKNCYYSGKVNFNIICRRDMTYRAGNKERKCEGFREVSYLEKILMKYGRIRNENSFKA